MALEVPIRFYRIELQVAISLNAGYQAVRFAARLVVALYECVCEWTAQSAVVNLCVDNCIFALLYIRNSNLVIALTKGKARAINDANQLTTLP